LLILYPGRIEHFLIANLTKCGNIHVEWGKTPIDLQFDQECITDTEEYPITVKISHSNIENVDVGIEEV
jgi:hypothetical protein